METAVAFIQYTVLTLGPLLIAALGGVWSGACGLPNFGLEGMMVLGGFAAVAAGLWTGSFLVGLALGALLGAGCGLLLALSVDRMGARPAIAGVGLHILLLGLTLLLAQGMLPAGAGEAALETTARLPRFTLSGMAGAGYIDLGSFLAAALLAVTLWLFYGTRFGLRLRTVGRSPGAIRLRGIKADRLRLCGLGLSGALAGLAGAALALGGGSFSANTFQGQGYLALMAASLGRYTPLGALWGSLVLGVIGGLGLGLEETMGLPPDARRMLLPLLALGYLALSGSRRVRRAQREPSLSREG